MVLKGGLERDLFWDIRVGLFISQEFRILAFKFWSFLFKLPVYWDMGCE
jgi:hypothetical protein